MDRGDRFCIVLAGVKFRHTHAPEPEFGDREALGSKFALFHTRFDRLCVSRVAGKLGKYVARSTYIFFAPPQGVDPPFIRVS